MPDFLGPLLMGAAISTFAYVIGYTIGFSHGRSSK